ncbi:MAG TPA: hypothetical protein VFO39_14805 [Candidatus Sulfotelmatobacter sp.]|nr:hypothetical protein [Candidatus Sulfotelmatobacter sp.]
MDANDISCETDFNDLNTRPIIVKLLPARNAQRPSIQFNMEDETWENAGERLRDIFKLRSVKTAFLQAAPVVNSQYRYDIVNIIAAAGVESVCVVNPGRPPGWFKPRHDPG